MQNFIVRLESGVERFAGLKKSDFKTMIEKLEPTEVDVLVGQLKSGAESLLELASFVENFKTRPTIIIVIKK